MVARTASPGQLYAAPFAVVGSIGVTGQTININQALVKWGIRPVIFRSGSKKVPLNAIGAIRKEGLQQVQSVVDATTHRAFQRHVVENRPCLLPLMKKLQQEKRG